MGKDLCSRGCEFKSQRQMLQIRKLVKKLAKITQSGHTALVKILVSWPFFALLNKLLAAFGRRQKRSMRDRASVTRWLYYYSIFGHLQQ